MPRPCALAVLALCLGSSGAFAPSPIGSRTRPVLSMSKDNNVESDGGKRFAAAAIASAYLLSGLFAADAALAAPVPTTLDFAGGSSTVTLAGRSGGRAGGRASAARPAPSRSAPSTTTIHKTTVIQQPPTVVVAPPSYGYGGGYGYAAPPGPGLGLALTVGAIDAIGDGMRESRQNNEIRNTRAQLEMEKQKEFELEQRLRMVEMNQMSQRQAPMPMMAPQMAPQYIQQ